MRVRLPGLLVGIVLVVPALAHADGHKADLFGGYADGSGGSRLFGGQASIAWGLPAPHGWLTIVAPDVGVRVGTNETQIATFFGPRMTLTTKSANKLVVHYLLGNVRTQNATGVNNELAHVIGIGYERYLHKTPTTPTTKPGTPEYSGLGIRVQVDYVAQNGDGENFTRVAAGFVYRILRH